MRSWQSERSVSYMENGNIVHSVNFPDCSMGACTTAGRIGILHRNVSGMISQYSTTLGDAGMNIAGMTNKSKGDYAYVLIDVDSPVTDEVIQKLENIEGVLKVRKVKIKNEGRKMLLTVGTTEAVEAIAEAQENLQEVAKNPGILRTYFQNLVPDLLNFALQVVIAVIVYAVGAKLIGLIVKIVRKTMERRNADVGVIQFLSAVVKYALYFILILTILSLFGIATTSAVAVLGSCGVAVGLALQGSLSELCRRSADPLLKPFV